MTLLSAAVLLILILAPFGNLVLINTLLRDFDDPRCRVSILRESLIACAVSTAILWASPGIFRRLGQRGALAVERLMGMLFATISVQMFLDGLSPYFQAHP
jgi:small neutral amino acid transporter SnatA (MarC family)